MSEKPSADYVEEKISVFRARAEIAEAANVTLSEANAALEVESRGARDAANWYSCARDFLSTHNVALRKSLADIDQAESLDTAKAIARDTIAKPYETIKSAMSSAEAALSAATAEIERLKGALEAKAPNIEMIAKAIAANHGWDGDNTLIKWRDFEGDARAVATALAASKAEAADLDGGDDERA